MKMKSTASHKAAKIAQHNDYPKNKSTHPTLKGHSPAKPKRPGTSKSLEGETTPVSMKCNLLKAK